MRTIYEPLLAVFSFFETKFLQNFRKDKQIYIFQGTLILRPNVYLVFCYTNECLYLKYIMVT